LSEELFNVITHFISSFLIIFSLRHFKQGLAVFVARLETLYRVNDQLQGSALPT
jgi:hypothetical protein